MRALAKVAPAALIKFVPQPLSNAILLRLPWLYRTPLVLYESYLAEINDRIIGLLDESRQVPGDIIECGAARCGTSCMIAVALRRMGISKRVFALDSFGGGFDMGELRAEREAGLTDYSGGDFSSNTLDYVSRKITSLGLRGLVIPVKGWFTDTLRTLPGPFSLAIIDCDLSNSTKECLEYIWPRMSANGILLIDDYWASNFKGVKKAVDDFLEGKEEEHTAPRRLGRLLQLTVVRPQRKSALIDSPNLKT